ncbi:YceI family protein [Flexithrix dorotheae]|uniref:YceI family protein n=1 Tax=Flexithrix dorotheae TaxID=70993 RepID=UPI00037125B3|nr:YceI family protein [Flexithrix dorotheae]
MKNIKKITSTLIGLAFILFSSFTTTNPYEIEAGKWQADVVHSNVQFTVDHLVISEVSGSFKMFEGEMSVGKEDFSDAKVSFTVDVASVDTDNEMRDNHLKSEDFFNAEKFSQMQFESTGFKSKGKGKYEMTGNLTIRDVTKPVTFEVKYGGTAKDGYGNTKAGFKAKTTINRFDYGLKWNSLTEAGGAVVGDEVEIVCNIQLKKA